MTLLVKYPVDEEEEPIKDWFLDWFKRRNDKTNVNDVLITGDRGTGKSRAGGAFIPRFDPSFIPSLKNHPVYSRDPKTAKYCHLSISPLPLLEALEENLLPKRSWWMIDEPRDLKSVDWWTTVAKVLNDTFTMYRETLVNVVVCAVVRGKILRDIRDLFDILIRMREPGRGIVWVMENRISKKSAQRLEIRVPRGIGPLNWPMASPEFEELYKPIREYGYKETLHQNIKTLKDKGYIG
jgi:hypothetical protein